MVAHSARVAATAAMLSLGTAAGAAPTGLASRTDTQGARVHLSVIVLADDTSAPHREATATRRLLEMTHRAGLWPVSLAVTPASLTGMLDADRDLARLLVDLKPTVLLVGADPPGRGLRAAAMVGERLDLVPALGAGDVGDMLREDTPMMASARALQAEGLVVAGGLIPPGRLAAGRPDPDTPVLDIDQWGAAWATADADAAGVEVAAEDADRVLADLARLAALANSLGLDPFGVPGVSDRLSPALRADASSHRWSPTPLRAEYASLSAAMTTAPDATLGALQIATATLARHVLSRRGPAAELAGRIAELPPDQRYRATQVFRARDVRPGANGQATLQALQQTTTALADLSPHLAIDPARVAENAGQWGYRAHQQWLDVFKTPPHAVGAIGAEELQLLHRDFRRRDQRRRARQR